MDLTPDIKLSLTQLNQQMRQRALAVLANAGIDSSLDALGAVGGAFWADILYVTTCKRASLDTQQNDALAKASAGLGYQATQYALLCLGDILAGEEAQDRATQIEAFRQALSAGTIVFLEKEATGEYIQHPETDDTFVKTVIVTDFFASLEESTDQLAKKKQAWQELQPAKRIPVMR